MGNPLVRVTVQTLMGSMLAFAGALSVFASGAIGTIQLNDQVELTVKGEKIQMKVTDILESLAVAKTSPNFAIKKEKVLEVYSPRIDGRPIDASWVEVSKQPDKISQEHPGIVFCNLLGYKYISENDPTDGLTVVPGERVQLKVDGSYSVVKNDSVVLARAFCSNDEQFRNIAKVNNLPARGEAPPVISDSASH